MAFDSTAAIIGAVTGGLFLFTFIYAISITLKYKALAPSTPTTPSALTEFLKTWSGLFPYVFFLAGFIIDAINSTYQYSKASIVGALSVLITTIFGSDKFASYSEYLLSFIPKIYTPFTTPPPPGTSWFEQINITAIFIYIAIGVVVFLPMMIGGLAGYAWGSTIAASTLLIIVVLAGNNFLGDLSPTLTVATRPSSATFAGITKLDICVTPGLESLQTRIAPIGILLTSSILSCHMFEGIYTGNNNAAIVPGSIIGASFLTELGILYGNGCLNNYKYGLLSPFISLALGTLSGWVAYFTMKQVGQESFISSSSDGGVFHPSLTHTKTSQSKSDTKIVVGPQPDTSEPVDDQDAFVCEAYKDGELVTSTIVD